MKLVKIFSKTCGPCKVLERNLQEAKVPYESIDVEEHEEIIDKYEIRSTPTLLIVNDNEDLIAKYTGILTVDKIKQIYNENN